MKEFALAAAVAFAVVALLMLAFPPATDGPAIPRTVDVRDFGAVPNDGGLDTLAIALAFSTNQRVYFPGGIYYVHDYRIPSTARLAVDAGEFVWLKEVGQR